MPPIRPEYVPVDRIPTDRVLAVVFFGDDRRAAGEALTVNVPAPQLGGALAEVWRADGDVTREERGGVAIARTADVLFGTIRSSEQPTDEATSAVYDAIVAASKSAGYPHLWRIWNHVGGINEDEAGLERYKRFSAGRHESLTRHGFAREQFPAASAVGMSEPGLLVYFVAGRETTLQAENPRQVSAYDYPPQYGPRSPSFSRATVVGDGLIFISGTASVVGHESRHAGSVSDQLAETVENLDVTLTSAAAAAGLGTGRPDLSVAKVYLRSGVLNDELRERLRTIFSSAILVEADICRRELLLEIEGVAVLPHR